MNSQGVNASDYGYCRIVKFTSEASLKRISNSEFYGYVYLGDAGGETSSSAIAFNSIDASDVTETTAHIQANVSVNRKVYEAGAEYSTSSSMSNAGTVSDTNYPVIRDKIWYDFGNGTYPALSKGTTYYYRFYYIENQGGEKHYSDIKSFTTKGESQEVAEYMTYDNVGIVSVADTSAIVIAEVSTNGDVIKYVAGLGDSGNSISWNGINMTSMHSLTWQFDDLQPATTYYYQYDVFTASGKDYKSGIYSFTTTGTKPDTERPQITDVKISNVTSSGFDVSCKVTDNVAVDSVNITAEADDGKKINGDANKDGSIYRCHIDIASNGGKSGQYRITIYAIDTSGYVETQVTYCDVPEKVVEPAIVFDSVTSSAVLQTTAHIEADVSVNRSCYEVGAEYSTDSNLNNALTVNDSNYPKIVNRIWYDFGDGYPSLSANTKYYFRFYYKEDPGDMRHYSAVNSFTTQAQNTIKKEGYDGNAAAAYAIANKYNLDCQYNGNYQCAEFVAACIAQGGLDVDHNMNKYVYQLRKTILNKGFIETKVTYSGTRTYTAGNTISVGDVIIFSEVPDDPYPIHAAIVTVIENNGEVKITDANIKGGVSANRSINYSTGSKSTAASTITVYCYHWPESTPGQGSSGGAEGEDKVASVAMYRLYNPNSGEHFYTANGTERSFLSSIGWKDEGIGWYAPKTSATPVYRLYNPNSGEHHYTTNASERASCISAGWNDEGIGWYSDDSEAVPLYREYNPNAVTGTHNYTTSKSEHDYLVLIGWKDENIGWYGVENH